MSMSTIKTDPTLRNASTDDPACVKAGDACPAFAAAHENSQAEVSYYHQYDYGHYVCWFLVVILGLFTAAYIYIRAAQHVKTTVIAAVERVAQKTRAAVRYVSYRRVAGPLSDHLGMPSMGIIILILLFTLYCLLLTFLVRPYYRKHRGYGSPPIGVRTGLMAIALTPWIIALSGKANIITILTGIGHEKLNIIHRWLSRICLVLSVIHTVPFLVAPLRDGGYAALHKQFYKHASYEYTGTPPLAILFGIVVLSVRWFRHRFYECFYWVHFLLGVSYVGLMFWHAGMEGDSWTYLWFTIAIWLASILARMFWYNRATNLQQSDWFQGYETDATLLPGDVTKLVVHLTEDISVKPGQHCFLRVPAISVLDNHPFTVAWAERGYLVDEKFHAPSLTFLVKSRRGFTAELLKKVASEKAHVWVDGPYGGLNAELEARYDHAIFVAGGIGITGCLPWLQNLVQKDRNVARLSSIKLVWVIHHASHIAWAGPYLQILSQAAGEFLTIDIFCTTLDPSSGSAKSEKDGERKVYQDDNRLHDLEIWQPSAGRPRLDAILGVDETGKIMVIGCGPNSLKTDLSNACAQLQSRVLKGELEALSLHTETFGW